MAIFERHMRRALCLPAIPVVLAGLSPVYARTQVGVAGQGPASQGWVALGCSNPGSQQDIAKTPVIKNTTAAPIPRGKSLTWKSSDGDTGSVTLAQDLAPGDSISGAGKPAPAYTCTARFYAGLPDLVVVRANFTSGVTVTVKNTNPWVDASPSSVRFELLKCSDNGTLLSSRAGPLPIAAGTTQKFSTSSKKPKGSRSHWRVTIDIDRRVAESNESNNVWANRSICVH
jgi:hypothetical protein